MELSDEEKKAIERLKLFEYRYVLVQNDDKVIETIVNLVDKQQKETERLNEIINSRYYHDLKCRELEKEINENWEDKIRELKEQVKKEKANNPYDFIYMINEILGEEDV